MQHKSYFSLLLQYCSDSVLLTLPSPARWSITLSTGPWSSGELGRGKSEKACRHTFGAAVPRHPLCIRFWCKLLLAKTLTVDRSDWHRLFGQHVARDLITKWQKQNSPKTVHKEGQHDSDWGFSFIKEKSQSESCTLSKRSPNQNRVAPQRPEISKRST